MRCLNVLLFPILLSSPSLCADDWPWWLGPERDGISRERGWLKEWPAGGPPRLWTKSIGGGYSGIVVARGLLILFHRVGDELRVDGLDPLTGKERWTFSYRTDYEDRYGYDGGPRSCPIVHGDKVYTLGPKGILHALELANGENLWRRDIRAEHRLESNFFGAGAAPIIEDGVLYSHQGGTDLHRGSGYVFAHRPDTGELLWKSPTDGGSYASPSIASIGDSKRLFILHRGGMSCFDPQTGRESWKYRWHSRTYESVNASTPLIVNDILFFSATYGTGSVCLRLKKDSYEELWRDSISSRQKIMEIHWAPPIHVDGHIYGFSGRHSNGCALRCVELESGEVRWSWRSPLYRGSMVYSDGCFIALGEYGDLILLKLSPEGHEEVVRVPRILRYPAWTVPTLANGLLYLRDLEKLICLDLRIPGKPPRTGQAAEARGGPGDPDS